MVRHDGVGRAFLLVAVVVAVAACRPPVPQQMIVPEAPRTAPAVVPVSVTAGPWSWAPVRERRAYLVTQRALITTRQDTLTKIDTVASELGAAFTQFVSANRISGSLTLFRVTSGSRSPATPAGITLPITVAASATPSGFGAALQWILTTPAEGAACSSVAWTVAQGLRDLWFRAPDTLRVGASWRDSTSYVTCRDGIPLQLSVRRDFRVRAVAERDGRAVLIIQRESHTTLLGDGVQFGEPVKFTGAGSGTLQFELAPATGEFLGGSGTSTLEFTMQSRLRTQRVQQAAVITLARGI
ncbi:MAG: hypothetical protein NTU67_10405 [Gemmatimonadetes bacterium]|nr:hypothetical protein [Gemmatimonadota bacterium]